MLSTVDGALGEPSQGCNTRLPEASVSPVARPSEPCLKDILWVSHCTRVCFLFFFLSVFENIYQKIDQAHQPLIYSPEPTNMLQSAPVRVTNLPLCI